MSDYTPSAEASLEALAENLFTPSLRDQFAMAALTGVMRASIANDRIEIARRAYEIADAMMEIRDGAKE